MEKTEFLKKIQAEKGASILESLIAILLLCLIFFGTMQVFHYAMSGMICRYAAFNGAKSWSLGYTKRITEKTVRLSAMGISGKDYSSPKMKSYSKDNLYRKMQMYMITGSKDIDFEYWDNFGVAKTRLRHSVTSNRDPKIYIRVALEHAPFLTDGIGRLLNMKIKDATLRSDYMLYNHSQKYLDY
jgi:hypothetical protein